MKTILFILSCLIYTNADGQFSKLKGKWLTPTLGWITISDTANNAKLESGGNMKFYQHGDTLSPHYKYHSTEYCPTEQAYKERFVDIWDMIVVNVTDSTLLARPCLESEKAYSTTKEIEFSKQEFLRDRTIHFEKIVYHTTTCFGSCPEIDLEIDSNKRIYIHASYLMDSSSQINEKRSGRFEGELRDSLYNELILSIQTCNLKTLEFSMVDEYDAPVRTIIIYFNGQRKYFKSNFPPNIANDLIDYLSGIRDRAKLDRTAEERVLEK
jgi:hypothetical protein